MHRGRLPTDPDILKRLLIELAGPGPYRLARRYIGFPHNPADPTREVARRWEESHDPRQSLLEDVQRALEDIEERPPESPRQQAIRLAGKGWKPKDILDEINLGGDGRKYSLRSIELIVQKLNEKRKEAQ